MALLYGKFARPSPYARTPVGTAAVKGIVTGDGVSIVISSTGVASTTSAAGPSFAENEIPTPAPNGVTTVFALAHTPNPSTSAKGYVNGARQEQGAGNDYTISGATITFAVAPPTGANILFDYRY